MTLARFVVPALAGVAAVVAPVAAQTATIGPSRNNTLYQDPAGALSNGLGQHFFAGAAGGADAARRGLMLFDVAGAVPAGATVTSVTLTLTMTRGNPGLAEVSLHRVLADWGEGTTDADGNEGAGGPATAGSATWIHRFHDAAHWETPGGDFAAAASAAQTVGDLGVYSWSSPGMAADVQAWLDGSAANFGWLARGDESIMGSAKRFDSRLSGEASASPRLVIEYVPAPGTALAALVMGAGAARRRRRVGAG